MVKSVSSAAKEFIASQALGYTFTTDSLIEAMKQTGKFQDVELTQGAVSGFCSRAIDRGVLTYTDVGRVRHYTYTSDVSVMPVHNAAGPGSSKGRTIDGKQMRRRPTSASLAERLFEIAADIEKLEPSLALVSTKDLLAELERRTTERQVV